jgi:hypothetical protein
MLNAAMFTFARANSWQTWASMPGLLVRKIENWVSGFIVGPSPRISHPHPPRRPAGLFPAQALTPA